MRRVAGLVATVMLSTACGQSGTTATTPTIEATTTTTVDPPWTTVPVPVTPPFEIVLESGEMLEVQAVCVEVETEGVVSQPWAEDDLRVSLSALGLDAEPGDSCEVNLRLWANAVRLCERYSDIGTCCMGNSGETIVWIDADGETLDEFRQEFSAPTLGSTTSGNCPRKDDPMRIGFSLGGVFDRWFGLVEIDTTSSEQPPFREDVFWRLVAALHHADSDVVDQAGKHLLDWVEAWEAGGSPSDGIPFMEAVPHLVSSLERGHYQAARKETLEKITQQRFGFNAADWWEWWEETSES